MNYLLDAGWTAERRVALPSYVLALNPSPLQKSFFEKFWGLSIVDINGNAINFTIRESFVNPSGEKFSMVDVFLRIIDKLKDSGIFISNGIPFCELPYAQDFTRIVVDSNLNFFNIYEDEVIFLGRGAWWAIPIIYGSAGLTDMYYSSNGGVEAANGDYLFDIVDA